MPTINIEGRSVPQPNYEHDAARLVRFYKNALLEIQAEIRRADVTTLGRAAQAYALQESIRNKLKELNKQANEWANNTIPDAALNGVAASLVSLGLVADMETAKQVAKFNKTNEKLVKTAIADTQQDVLAISQYINKNIAKSIRDIAAVVIREKLTQGYGMRTIKNEMTNRINQLQDELGKAADVAIRDNANRVWKTETYTEMLARTKLMNVHTEAVTNDAVGRGAMYAIISTNPRTRDACIYHEGQIVKLDPSAEGDFATYDGLRGTGQIFHPNCKHHLLPFRRFDRLSNEALKTAQQQEVKSRAAIQAGGRNPNSADVQKGAKDFKDAFKIPSQPTQAKAIVEATGAPQTSAKISDLYKPAKNVKEANAWAAQHLPIAKVDYKGYDIRLANEMNRQLAKLLDNYEKVRNIKYIGTSQARNKGLYEQQLKDYVERLKAVNGNEHYTDEQLLTYAKKRIKKRKVAGNNYASATNHTWGAYEGVTWNEAFSKDYDKIQTALINDVKSKWHPEGTEEPTSVITHEFGHMVDYYIQHGDIDVYNKIVKPVIDDIKKNHFTVEIEEQLSRYAYTNHAEMIAESFAEYYHNPHPRPMCKSIVEALNKAYNIVAKAKGGK